MSETVFKETVLELKNLNVGYSSKEPILKNINLEVEKGEIIALVGPSGAGKTTLIKTIASIIPQTSGEICILGECCVDCLPSGNVGYIPQRLGLVNNKTVIENIIFGKFHEMNFLHIKFYFYKTFLLNKNIFLQLLLQLQLPQFLSSEK